MKTATKEERRKLWKQNKREEKKTQTNRGKLLTYRYSSLRQVQGVQNIGKVENINVHRFPSNLHGVKMAMIENFP